MPRIGLGVIVLALIALALLAPFAGTLLIESEPPTRTDAIVVLAGNAPDRLPLAETLREQHFGDLLIVSNERVHTHGLETTWLALHQAGVSAPEVPDSALVVVDDPPPESTLDEAGRDAAIMQSRGLKSALLVTDAFHSRRATLTFRAAFGHRGLTVHPVAVDDKLDLAHWWSHPLTARRVIEEWVKLAFYFVQGALF